jgi:hypothetical protein
MKRAGEMKKDKVISARMVIDTFKEFAKGYEGTHEYTVIGDLLEDLIENSKKPEYAYLETMNQLLNRDSNE